MSAIYRVQVMHVDRDAWLADLRQAMAAELIAVGLHRTVTVVVSDTPVAGDGPTIAVYLGSPAGATDASLAGAIDAALATGTVVFPVVEDLPQFSSLVPPQLRPIDGFAWAGGVTP